MIDRADLFLTTQTFAPSQISGPARTVLDVEVAETESGTAILTNFGEFGSSVAVLACSSSE